MVKPKQLGHVVLRVRDVEQPKDGDLFGSTPFPLGSLEEEPAAALGTS